MSVEGWKTKALGSVAEIIMGQSPDSRYYSEEEIGLPFLQGCAEFTSKFPSAVLFCSQVKKIARTGSILFSVRAPVGRTNLTDTDYIIGRGLAALIASQISQDYLHHYLVYSESGFRNNSQGSTFEAINSKELRDWAISFPEFLQEQTQIATILSTIDRAIEQTEALIAKQQRIKTGLMQDLLTKGIDENGNIRSEETHEFKDSPLGRIPVEWEVKPLASVAEIIMGQSPQGYTYNQIGEGTPLINGPTEFGTRYIERVNQWTTSPTKLCKRGDVLFCVRGSTTGRINIANDVYCIGRGLAAIREVKNKSINSFLELFLTQLVEQLFSEASGSGSTFPSITSNRLSATLILVPSIEEQNQIVLIINSYDRHICTEETHLNKLHSLKTGLMQDLLTGKVRVTELIKERETDNL
jgi:type I restriction enzyme S subunit